MLLPMIAEPVVPPGFRFRPTDEELVEYYLKKKVESSQEDLDVIREIDLYKLEPWDLQEACKIGFTEQDDWYFFSHKDKKYPTGTRMNRATTAGFWKATGRDKAIYAKLKLVGMRKTLVFYKGRAPNGQKTDWIMHEYRLESYENGRMQANEEGWVVCRVFKKRCTSIKKSHELDFDYFYDDFLDCIPDPGSAKNAPHIGELPYNPSFTCMQELALNCHLLHDPFMQLPQLESPKVSSYVSTSNIKALAGENSESMDYQSPAFDARKTNFGWPLTEMPAMSAFPTNVDANEEQQMTDWRVLDKLVASQLIQDDVLKGIKLPSKADDTLRDLAICIHHSKQQNDDYPTSNSIHLWDFKFGS